MCPGLGVVYLVGTELRWRVIVELPVAVAYISSLCLSHIENIWSLVSHTLPPSPSVISFPGSSLRFFPSSQSPRYQDTSRSYSYYICIPDSRREDNRVRASLLPFKEASRSPVQHFHLYPINQKHRHIQLLAKLGNMNKYFGSKASSSRSGFCWEGQAGAGSLGSLFLGSDN